MAKKKKRKTKKIKPFSIKGALKKKSKLLRSR